QLNHPKAEDLEEASPELPPATAASAPAKPVTANQTAEMRVSGTPVGPAGAAEGQAPPAGKQTAPVATKGGAH
ncbi:MAG: hypothetical protein WCD31_13095, partial [Gillisia sp.]